MPEDTERPKPKIPRANVTQQAEIEFNIKAAAECIAQANRLDITTVQGDNAVRRARAYQEQARLIMQYVEECR